MANIFRSDSEINKIKESKEFKNAASKADDLVNNKQFQDFKNKYQGKSEEEIMKDAKDMGKKLKQQYGEQEYNKKIEDLKNFEKFLRKFLENLDE